VGARVLLLGLLGPALSSCRTPPSDDGFGGTGGVEVSVGSTSSSTGSSGAAPAVSTSSSSSTSGANSSTAAELASDPVGTTSPPDLGVTGCAGKVDFLFVLSNQETMEPHAKQMQEAVPAFIETLETRFAEFDNHILVTDANGVWGSAYCQDCDGSCAHGPPEYPCLYPFELEACDMVEGAGVTFPVGWGTQNKRCEVFGGNRYMIADDPTPHDTFTCLASVGWDGGDNAPVEVMLKALRDDLNEPGGCNAGFLRDDALLVIVIVADTYEGTKGNPEDWRAELLAHKGDDANAVVLLAVTTDIDLEEHVCLPLKETNPNKNPMRALVELMTPQALIGGICEPSWAPFFEAAADLVLEQCDVFAPG